MRAGVLAFIASLLLTGCAHALAPPLADRVTPGADSALLVEGALEACTRAGTLWLERTPASAREAAALWIDIGTSSTDLHTNGNGSDGDLLRLRLEALENASRALVWLTGHEPDPAAREADATLAVQAAQSCRALAPISGRCAYWLGAALGVQARERPSTGLSALPLIEKAFEAAAASEPEYEDAGPDRALALLYLRAPEWPAGPGDPDRGLELARRALALKPGSPANHLALAEALEATGATEEARASRRAALELAEAARVAGNPDAPEWIEEARRGLEGRGRDSGAG